MYFKNNEKQFSIGHFQKKPLLENTIFSLSVSKWNENSLKKQLKSSKIQEISAVFVC